MNAADEFDVEGPVPTDKLDELHKLLEEAIALDRLVEQQEEDLKNSKGVLHRLRTARIPDLMTELQMTELTFRGWKVQVDDFVSGSLPKDEAKRAAAISWLEAHDASGLIKTEISVQFGRSEHNLATSVYQQLVESGHTTTMEATVHAQTLQSFARQRIKGGEDIDPEVLGLYVGKVAKMKEVKK